MPDSWPLAKKRRALTLRARILRELRRFFADRDYLEIETPCLIPAPAPECHIDAMACEGWFLHPSPELCMKRLLAAGYDRIFQICRCFRKGERGARHLPEFTMLEWYRREADYRDLMVECEELLSEVAAALGCDGATVYQGETLRLGGPWERLTVAEAFARFSPLSATEALARDCFDEILAIHVEPQLGRGRPTILYDYPLPLASLARSKREAPAVAERFELYLAGIELANGFTELAEEGEQRRRFAREEEARRRAGKPPYPTPDKFLKSLPDLGEAAGIALGVDRLVMILADAPDIDAVTAFTPETL
ncbi:MAG: EF-P lysine aminoacylase EpmA [Pseudomonadota bacterium]|nr:EF-P lysine aminoacylase EpmA [Pseudomonadota bacterium]